MPLKKSVWWLAAWIVVGGVGCGGGAGSDAAPESVDAARPDAVVVGVDAGDDTSLDAATEDALVEDAASADAPDVGTDLDGGEGGACGVERCNAFDDDCDGAVDEGACGRCVTRVDRATNHVYAFCPGSIFGHRAWTDGCAALDGSYRLADLDTVSESLFVSAAVDGVGITGITRFWVGLQSFGLDRELVDSEGRPRDRTELLFEADDTTLAGDDCYAISREGLRDLSCVDLWMAGPLCEAEVRTAPPTSCGTETCNALDDDCDGRVDEQRACTGCDTLVFAGHVYRVCDDQLLSWDAARDRCIALGGDLSAVDTAFERDAFLPIIEELNLDSAWIGLRDEGTGWTWTDGRVPGSPEAPFTTWHTQDEPARPRCGFRTRQNWGDSDCRYPRAVLCEQTPVRGP